jgi:hypothetical protein
MTLSLKHRLSPQGYYWYNIPKSAGFPFLAVVEHTNFISPAHFGGEHIVYLGDYLEPEHENFRLTKDELLERFLAQAKLFSAGREHAIGPSHRARRPDASSGRHFQVPSVDVLALFGQLRAQQRPAQARVNINAKVKVVFLGIPVRPRAPPIVSIFIIIILIISPNARVVIAK